MTPESIRAAHARALPVVKEVQRYVQDTIRPMATANGYLFMDRLKDSESLSEKLESGRIGAWSEIDDLYGATVVVPVAQHEEQVVEFLNNAFELKEVRSRSSTRKDPAVFRFDGLRWYGFPRAEISAEKQPGFGDLVFEVQVITAFEWAWSRVTHDLVYKGENADWRHRRLAAHLKASVEQIELMIAAFDEASNQVNPSPWPETDSAEKVVARFRSFVRAGLLDEAGAPRSWSRFGDNVVSVVKSYRKGNDLSDTVDILLDALEGDLRAGGGVPVSAGYFQYVIGFLSREESPGNTERYVVVPSSEYELLGARDRFPKEFTFDGTAVATAASDI